MKGRKPTPTGSVVDDDSVALVAMAFEAMRSSLRISAASKSPPMSPRPPASVTADASAPPAKPAMGALTMSGDDVHGNNSLSIGIVSRGGVQRESLGAAPRLSAVQVIITILAVTFRVPNGAAPSMVQTALTKLRLDRVGKMTISSILLFVDSRKQRRSKRQAFMN
jgi:hypothetical protein